jgi:hypothetical protein
VPGPVQQQAARAFHGADRAGKDGPLAKMGFDLTQLYHEKQAPPAMGAKQSSARRPWMIAHDGYVTIDAVAERDAAPLLTALEALGLKGGARAGRVVSGRLPIRAIPDAAALPTLRFARPAVARTFTGNATSEGDAAMQADGARRLFSVDGDGLMVGVLSDSYNTVAGDAKDASDDISSGDLPGDVTVLEDYGDDPGEGDPVRDEGRAMLQIVHDVAPGADLAFHTALGGQAHFAQGIHDLADAGADIVVDDVLYPREPMFQDGIIAQAVDEVKSDDGVAYFSAAGNLADQSWEELFIGSGQDGPLGDGNGQLHAFEGTTTCQPITVPTEGTITVAFQWDEPYASAGIGNPGSSSDIDIFVRDKQEGTVLASSEDANVGNDPIEVLDFTNDGSTDVDDDGSDTQFCFGIELQEGTAPGRMKYVYEADGGISVANDGEPTLYGHANARGAEAVGASSYGSDRAPRTATALGGVPILFDTEGARQQDDASRQKPGIAAPDCVSNTFFGESNTFCGTSAAAAHAAAVAALMLEHRPELTVDEVYGILRGTAHDIGAAGVDDRSGDGFIQADQATLPVELVAFEAVAEGEDVVLTWQTASETNNAGFRIEHRPQDGTFKQRAFVPGAGTTVDAQSYRHRVTGLSLGRHAFRLQQVDIDGAVHTSPVVETVVALDTAYRLSAVHPNPVRATATITLSVHAPQTLHAAMYDALGRRVQTLHIGRVAAHEPLQLTIKAETLPSGLYLIRLHGETFSATRRVTVVR